MARKSHVQQPGFFYGPVPLALLSNRSHPALTPSLSIFQGNIVDSTATALIDGVRAKTVF